MNDSLTPYEKGLDLLLERLGMDHSRYVEALTYEQRLRENILKVRRYGDDESKRSNRALVVEQLNRLALGELEVSYNQLCGLESSRSHPKGILNRLFLKMEVPPDLPLYERVAALLVSSLGQIREESIGVLANLLGLMVLSALFAYYLAQGAHDSRPGLLLAVIWVGLTFLPLIAGFLPQQREKLLESNYSLTSRQRLALRLDKLLGVYVSAYLVEIGTIVIHLGLAYLGLWSAFGTIGQGVFWFVAEWLTFVLAFIGSVIAVKYWENLLREEREVRLQAQHFLLGLGFPIIIYPGLMLFGILTLELWRTREFGCTVIGLGLLLLAFFVYREARGEE